ncbi:MAG: hypothetical protein PHV05_07160 [Candidatus Riflebacteria bacterium]|nr:hypothetical protein [Candidatus Riflebacteria bacterium]
MSKKPLKQQSPSEPVVGEKAVAAAVFELQITEINADRAKYPVQTRCKTIGFFSTLERAEACMRSEANTRAHHFTIKTRLLDATEPELWLCEQRVYDRQGRFHGIRFSEDTPFAGVSPEKCRFSEGDIVEIIQNGQLRPGIISLLPISPERAARIPVIDQSDNSYCIELAGNGRSHDHLPECDIFAPTFQVSAATKARLLRIYRDIKTSWV